MRKLIATLSLFFAISLSINAQNLIIEKFSKIKPGISTKDDVEKLLGKSDFEKLISYETPEFVIFIHYSDKDCSSGAKVWGIPKGTVQEVRIYLNQDILPLKLKEVILDLSKFKKRQISDVFEHVYYQNFEMGISVTYDTDIKSVIEMTFSLTQMQQKAFACKAN